MTVYDDFEGSAHDGGPVECYKFIGSFRNYLYTSADVPQTVNGEVYEPAAAKRGAVRAGTHADDTLSLEVEMPFNLDVVRDYAYAESPPSLTLEVYRVHRGSDFSTDWALFWKGKVSSFNVNNRVAKVRVPSIFSRALQSDLPNVYWQAPCNHVLYDARCKVSRAAYSTTTTVTDVGTTAFNVVDDGGVDAVLKAGEAVNNRTGERRLILDNVAGTISVNFPYVDMRVGDEVELVAGCDHSYATCGAKFANKVNYGGHPFIPADNPFTGEVS